jgi:hypothetical protein
VTPPSRHAPEQAWPQDGPEAEETARSGPDGTGHDINLTAGQAQASVLPAGQGTIPAASTGQAHGAANRPDTTQTRERATAQSVAVKGPWARARSAAP